MNNSEASFEEVLKGQSKIEIVDKLEKGDSNILEGYIDLVYKSSFYNKIGYIFSYLISFILISSIIIRFLWLKL